MDEADIAAEFEERLRTHDLLKTLRTAPQRPQPTGECLAANCGEPLKLRQQLFCDHQCAAFWERYRGQS